MITHLLMEMYYVREYTPTVRTWNVSSLNEPLGRRI